ncbi:hypothetical protein ADK78_14670, partial [Kitasatospora aureofaciens]
QVPYAATQFFTRAVRVQQQNPQLTAGPAPPLPPGSARGAGPGSQLLVLRAPADDLINWLHATDRQGNRHALLRGLGSMYMIWNRRIWMANRPDAGWQPYRGSNPHTNHI